MLESQIKNLSAVQMMALYDDVIYRIGSHVIGGNPDVNYIRKQEKILNIIQDEFIKKSLIGGVKNGIKHY
ncbi:hypothetical protein [Heyndrickxia ginsengihumi]|uniref:hypothetical protein n=1 Tax=Heyndrickxia ginsengihumi TaxID=363870 RepID=UPI00046F2792|nr:hypothetical protein [Heyndrickxia ginsengihumi]